MSFIDKVRRASTNVVNAGAKQMLKVRLWVSRVESSRDPAFLIILLVVVVWCAC